jgi:hypothetical protein
VGGLAGAWDPDLDRCVCSPRVTSSCPLARWRLYDIPGVAFAPGCCPA